MSYPIAGIDVHKKILMVVLADAAEPDFPIESRQFGTTSAELKDLCAWLCDAGVKEAVMESTAQYWRPVWMELEPHMRSVFSHIYLIGVTITCTPHQLQGTPES